MTRRLIALLVGLTLIVGACGDDDTATDTPPTTMASGGSDTTTTAASGWTMATPTTAAPPTTAAATTMAAFEPPPFVTLDDGSLAMEPPDIGYRAMLAFTMTATLADGTVQEGMTFADGGKIIADDGTVSHSFVVDTEGLTNIPDCLDLAALTPTWVSVYDTFYGGDAGDLAGDAMLAEAGIMTNGVLVDRYAITLDNIKPEESNEYTSFDAAYVDIARDGGHLVRLRLEGLGRNNTFTVDQTEPRLIFFSLDFSEFGEITEFTRPEGCPA